MSKAYEEVARMPICLEKGEKYQVEIVGNEVVVSKERRAAEWVDVTDQCVPDYRHSQHVNGRYLALLLKVCGKLDKVAAVIGTKGIIAQKGFKVEPAPNAHISFRVFRKCL